MLSLLLALAMLPGQCSLTVGIGKGGVVYSDRFHGWYRTNPATLERDLRGGCYNDAEPQPVSSVRLFVAADAPKSKVDSVLTVLRDAGWGRERIDLERWNRFPRKP